MSVVCNYNNEYNNNSNISCLATIVHTGSLVPSLPNIFNTDRGAWVQGYILEVYRFEFCQVPSYVPSSPLGVYVSPWWFFT